ncbi:hypothetical protein [Symmachiella dynata]|uniref:hypothetical protein n=1 Tax=Symmachiella dynata TaxID=2527995 RepID=UPI0030ECFDE1
MSIDVESAIQQFLRNAKALQSKSQLTAEDVLQWMAAFYRNERIEGAEVDADGDMLLLQWGIQCPPMATEPIDIRNTTEVEIRFEDFETRYIDFTRQIFAAVSDDAEFDDSAIQLSLTLIYGPASGDEPSSNIWISEPDQLVEKISEFRQEPFVEQLLGTVATRLEATVQRCG